MSAHRLPSTSPVIGAGDPLYRMTVYRLALTLSAAAWNDAVNLHRCPITRKVAGQLYGAAGSIRANLSEGYSRASGADRARLFEYALGSARECRDWYDLGRPVLGDQLVSERDATLVHIVRILLAIIPRERSRRITQGER